MSNNYRKMSVFIDESGNTKVNDELYVCAAFMIPTEEVPSVFSQIRDIMQKHSLVVIKSNKIRSANTRTQLLREICCLNFSYIAMLVNKNELDHFPGLQYTEPFYKFLHRRFAVYIDSVTKCDELQLEIDSYGSETFEEQFKKYFAQRMSPMFPQVTINFVKDEDSYGVQIADLIAGTLGRCYQCNRDSDNAETWLNILSPRCAGHKVFPPRFDNEKEVFIGTTEEEQRITECLLENAYEFIAKNMASDDEFVQRQCMTLRLLIAKAHCSENNNLYSDEIMSYLIDHGFEKISKQVFTAKVIGKLREARIIIAGNANGYRLALSKDDIESYIRHNDAIISPMIYRLGLAAEFLNGAFRVNVLEDYYNLQKFVDVYRHNATLVGTEIDEEEGILADEIDSSEISTKDQ